MALVYFYLGLNVLSMSILVYFYLGLNVLSMSIFFKKYVVRSMYHLKIPYTVKALIIFSGLYGPISIHLLKGRGAYCFVFKKILNTH